MFFKKLGINADLISLFGLLATSTALENDHKWRASINILVSPLDTKLTLRKDLNTNWDQEHNSSGKGYKIPLGN